MPTTHQTSTMNMLSIKVVLISTSVLSAAFMLSSTDIAVYVPWIYNGIVSWLRPPYLYLVINCIIITIVASSKLQSTSDDVSSPPPIAPPSNAISAVPQQPIQIIQTDFLTPTTEYNYEGVEKKLEFDEELDARGSSKNEDSSPVVGGAGGADDATSNKENECVVASKSMWRAAENNDVRNYVKPPASARFSHRRNLKASPEGGRTVLGVSKPKKQDTLENTWKAITEGRSIPMSRHLKISDTWDRDRRHQQENTPPLKAMKKAETFNDRRTTTTTNAAATSPSPLRKEASLSQDDLNRRVEAFIKKFNEEMRLQRQESLNQYTEMISRGSH